MTHRFSGRDWFASSHDAASYAAPPPALNRLRESLVEFIEVREEPHLFAAIRFGYKSAQGRTFSEVSRDVADDHKAPPILHEFLDQLARDARFQLKELIVKTFDRDYDHRRAIFKRLADEIHRILIGPQLRPVWNAFEYAHALKFVEFRR
jgi:hypothetical protein